MPAPKKVKPQDPAKLLKELLSKDELPGAVLVISPDRTRRERIVRSLLSKFCPGYNPERGKADSLSAVDASHLNASNIQELLDEANSLSLFTTRKFILINNLNELSSALNKKIMDLSSGEHPHLSLVCTAKKFPANSQVYNHFKKNLTVIELSELKNIELNRWTQKELRAAGLETGDEIFIEALIQSAEQDPDKLYELIQRLSLYLDDEKPQLDHLARLTKHAPQASEFALLDTLPNKKLRWRSEILIDQIFDSDKNSFALLGLLARTYNNYLQIRALQQRGLSLSEIRQRLNASPWIFNKQADAAKYYSLEALEAGIEAIFTTDAKLKNKNLGDKAVFSELISRL